MRGRQILALCNDLRKRSSKSAILTAKALAMKRASSSTFILMVLASAAPLQAQAEQSAIRALIADQAALLFGVITLHDPRFSSARIPIDTVRRLSPTVVLWRGEVSDLSHPSPFLIATVSGIAMPLRLGGFPGPRLEELSAALSRPLRSTADAVEFSHTLASIADPSGARDLVFPADEPSRSEAIRGWKAALPRVWPKDTAVALSRGLFYVARTVLSHNKWSGYGHPWLAIAYTFFLRSDGLLLAWDRHEGPLIPESR